MKEKNDQKHLVKKKLFRLIGLSMIEEIGGSLPNK